MANNDRFKASYKCNKDKCASVYEIINKRSMEERPCLKCNTQNKPHKEVIALTEC